MPTDSINRHPMDIEASCKGSSIVTQAIWELAGLDEEALARLTLSGERPLLPTSFQVGVAAQSCIASAALAATEIARLRSGLLQNTSVDMHDAEYECTGYFTLDGIVPNIWAPLSGLYPCRDGHVRIHANFDHHRDGALKILGLDDDPSAIEKSHVEYALKNWDAIEFEQAAANEGLVVSAVRSFSEWDQTPHAKAIADQPLLTIDKIGDAEPIPHSTIKPSDRPLSGMRVLDLTRILAGPVCGRTLAAYGANVMLVNSPVLPNIENIAETSRGKRSTLLDLNQAVDVRNLNSLVGESHLFVQGYRPGGLAKLGFSPEQLAEIRPGIVYVSLNAYGNQGPWSDRRGFDSLVQTATGFNHAEAEASGVELPKPLPVQILDYASGFLMAFAAQAALLKQMEQGGSWHVQVSLAQTAHWLRNLGRVPNNFHKRYLDFSGRAKTYQSDFGVLAAMPHAAGFSHSKSDWVLPSALPGTHAPSWN
jgi:crotonobetainyl-CoA:carnitine CoA-transferase CaiB-like acyl-CoA transferase